MKNISKRSHSSTIREEKTRQVSRAAFGSEKYLKQLLKATERASRNSMRKIEKMMEEVMIGVEEESDMHMEI